MKKKLLLLALMLSNLTIGYSQSWSQLVSPTTSNIISCSFVNENVGWIISQNAIYKTVNGGTSWIEQNIPLATANDIVLFNKIHFIDALTGIIACSNDLTAPYDPTKVSAILWTNDGGASWEFKNLGGGEFFNDAKLVNSSTAYTISSGGHCRKTVDGGETWTTINYFTSPNSNAYSLAAVNVDTVYFAGVESGFFHYGSFGKSENGGADWNVMNVSPYNMHSLYFTDAANGWIGGDGGVIKKTIDGGDSWSTSPSNVDSTVQDIVFTNILTGWGVTNDAKILHSTDGGENWNIDYTTTNPLNSLSFVNEVGFAVGDSGTLLKYSPNLGLSNVTTSSGFTIYPNPANDIINIQLDNVSQGTCSIEIYNAYGQIVKTIENINNQLTSINRNNMPSGVYFMQLSQDNKKFASSKLIIN